MEFEGLTEFQRDLLEVANETLPRESFKLMRKMGSKARTITARKARQEVGKVTGNYQKSWKRGKAWKDDDEYFVRVYNSSPHHPLIENGHRIVGKDGSEHGFKEGKHIIEKSMNDFDDQIEEMVSDWLDDLLESGDL